MTAMQPSEVSDGDRMHAVVKRSCRATLSKNFPFEKKSLQWGLMQLIAAVAHLEFKPTCVCSQHRELNVMNPPLPATLVSAV